MPVNEKTKRNLTVHIGEKERCQVEEAIVHYRKRTGENITLGKVAREQSVKWAKSEMKKKGDQS